MSILCEKKSSDPRFSGCGTAAILGQVRGSLRTSGQQLRSWEERLQCARFVTSIVCNCKTGAVVVTVITVLVTLGHHVIHTDSIAQGESSRTIMENLLF